MWVFLQQCRRGDDLARCADAALKAAIADKGILQRGQVFLIGRQALNGGDPCAIDADRGQQARAHDLTVDQHAARATHANAATLLGAGQAKVVAQQVDQAAVRSDGDFARGSVEFEAHDMLGCRGHLPILPT